VALPDHGALGRQPGLPLASLTRRRDYPWLVVGTVCVGAFMAALDASIVTIALPSIGHTFNADVNLTSWVSIAYLITLTAMVVSLGRLADAFGRRTVYTAGFGVFIVGSALCGAAPSIALLLAARVLQAVGAGMLQSNSVAIVTSAAPGGSRGRAIGLQAAAQAVGLALGPTIGGLLVAALGWRAVFYVNVPVGILGTLAGLLLLPRDLPTGHPAEATGPRPRFDLAGAILLGVALVGVMFALTQGATLGWGSTPVLGAFAAAAAAAVGLVFVERRADGPLLDPRLLRGVALMGNATGLLSYAATFGVLFLMPYEFARGFGLGPALSGLYLTAVPLAMMACSPFGGALADRYGAHRLTVVGAAVMEAGLVSLAILGFVGSAPALLVPLALIGAGMGLFTPPNNSAVMASAPPGRLGTLGGILNMARSLGMGLGSAVAASLYATLLLVYAGRLGEVTRPLSNLEACRGALLGLTFIAAVMVMLTLVRSDGDDLNGPVDAAVLAEVSGG